MATNTDKPFEELRALVGLTTTATAAEVVRTAIAEIEELRRTQKPQDAGQQDQPRRRT